MKSKYRIILHLVDDLPMDDYADIFLEPSVSRHQADLLIRIRSTEIGRADVIVMF